MSLNREISPVSRLDIRILTILSFAKSLMPAYARGFGEARAVNANPLETLFVALYHVSATGTITIVFLKRADSLRQRNLALT